MNFHYPSTSTETLNVSIRTKPGSMLIWRGMVKFYIQDSWVWLSRSEEDGTVVVRGPNGLSQVELCEQDYALACAFFATAPL